METTAAKRISWRRIGLCLAIIFAAGYLATLVTDHVGVWYLARKEARDPESSILPQRLPNIGVADLQGGQQVNDFGYVFDLPWKVSKRTGAKTVSTFTLENGTWVFIAAPQSLPPGLASIEKDTPAETAAFRSVYGILTEGSRYDWMQAELYSSPSDVSFWRSRSHNSRALVMLMSKHAAIQNAKVIYTLSVGRFHGFQFGVPQQAHSPVNIRLFDANDHELWIGLRRAPNGGSFTQEQINAIMASIRPATP